MIAFRDEAALVFRGLKMTVLEVDAEMRRVGDDGTEPPLRWRESGELRGVGSDALPDDCDMHLPRFSGVASSAVVSSV